MVRFMERAAAVAGADAEAVVGDFAETGSDPVHRGDMALLIARLLVAATDKDSMPNVKTNDDGTFAVEGVEDKDWDYFADSRRSQNRVHDSAVSALYELGVAKGTGMGYFSPASTVNRGAMAAFITRALAHTTARPAGVTIQSPAAGEVIVSVRDANFHPVPNEPVDVFSIDTAKADEAFNEDGECGHVDAVDSNRSTCTIDALDPITGLNGDYSGAVDKVADGGTTVWAWTGDSGDKVEGGGEELASINLTEVPPAVVASVSIKTDMAKGAKRAVFGSTVTVTIQLVDDEGNPAGPPQGGVSYRVATMRDTDTNNLETDVDPTAAVAAGDADKLTTNVYEVDASGKATFTITASDPDPADSNTPNGAGTAEMPNKIDRVRVSYMVTLDKHSATDPVLTAITPADTPDPVTAQTIVFSDAAPVVTGGSVKTATPYLAAPTNGGTASNVATVTVLDQYARPMRGQLVRLKSNHSTVPPEADDLSEFQVARRTDSSGTVRIGYTHKGTGSQETLTVTYVSATDPDSGVQTFSDLGGSTPVTTIFNWVSSATSESTITDAVVRVSDTEKRLLVVGGTASAAPRLVPYDAGDQFEIDDVPKSIADFEKALAGDKDNNDKVTVTSFDHKNLSGVARFELTVEPDAS